MASKPGRRTKEFALAAAIALVPIASPYAPANAANPPYEGCVAVTKQEYNAAKKQHLLRTRFTQYLRTGFPGRRYYWYCR
jgi:hypothetical protein